MLTRLPVLDVRSLQSAQLDELAQAYDNLASQPLSPLPLMAQDPVRAEIDAVITRTLNLPDFSTLREMLSREPVVCLKRL